MAARRGCVAVLRRPGGPPSPSRSAWRARAAKPPRSRSTSGTAQPGASQLGDSSASAANLVEISVRISSPALELQRQVERRRTLTVCAAGERSHISIHCCSRVPHATGASNASRSKSASSSRLITGRTFLLNAAVTPWLSSYARQSTPASFTRSVPSRSASPSAMAAAQPVRKSWRCRRIEVADRAAEERDQPRPVGCSAGPSSASKSRDGRGDAQPRVVAARAPRRASPGATRSRPAARSGSACRPR